MNKVYKSVYAAKISAYIGLKRQLGYSFETGVFYLGKLDELALSTKETQRGISENIASLWCKRNPNESDNNHYNRVRHLISFSSYLIGMGIESFIPKAPKYRKSTFIPYIYSKEEISELFKAADNLKQTSKVKSRAIIVMPALVRLLYATGLRLGEALNLKDEHVDLEKGLIHIKHSKNGQERTIPIAESLSSVLQEYIKYRNMRPFNHKNEGYFFVKINGTQCKGASIRTWFNKALLDADIKPNMNGLPRIHDLRHTFAVSSCVKMSEDETDLYAALPILSTYLGHQRIAATNHYIRLTVHGFPDLMKKIDKITLNVFPDFSIDEEIL